MVETYAQMKERHMAELEELRKWCCHPKSTWTVVYGLPGAVNWQEICDMCGAALSTTPMSPTSSA